MAWRPAGRRRKARNTERPLKKRVCTGAPDTSPLSLAEVDFLVAEVSKHSAREKSIRHGHPSTLQIQDSLLSTRFQASTPSLSFLRCSGLALFATLAS